MTSGTSRRGLFGTTALAGALALSIAGTAVAQERVYSIPAQSLAASLRDYGIASGEQIIFAETIVSGRQAPPLQGAYDSTEALGLLLADTGLIAERASTGGIMIRRADDPQSGSAAGDGAGTVEALIVTAQKREEDIQDVPIAMSAFTQEALTTHQIAGGPDLMTQIPNFTFTKTNFSGYSIQIRGIGTQAVSATVDPAVAVAFNNTPFIRNRFFEQEFYDLQRVEVLRGPQGTLYGRNATAGVVNLLTRRPTDFFEAKLSADVSNYSSTRLEGMVNIPLVEDKVALRLAGAWTKRDGYVTNIIDGTPTDGRDLWSTRLTLGFEPTDAISAHLTWEHFEEDDDRLRTGKQLCTRHIVPDWLPQGGSVNTFSASAYTSQGCEMGSLYEADAFQVPNGYALPYWGPLQNLSIPIRDIDPYLSTTQSRDLREIETSIEPEYNAKTDILHLAVEVDLTDDLTFTSETGYTADELFSLNDYNRFNTRPGVFRPEFTGIYDPVLAGVLDANGVFCDPQLGCSDRLVAADISTARSDQFSQEFRVSSNYDGPFNFHIGANFLRYDTVDKYYVFVNTLSMYSVVSSTDQYGIHPYVPGMQDITACLAQNKIIDPDNVDEAPSIFDCTYTDPNPIGSLNDYGRNYFLSKNPFRLISYAVFGEMQYEITEALKLTAGLRFTVDKKHSPIIPTWLLTGQTYGLPTKKIIDQEWREPTGRLVLDWSPVTGFTDETMVYASYARGYKAGGVNPPLPGGLPLGDNGIDFILATQPETFDAEFVDAYELGTKNTLLDGRMTLNANLFYYDYKNYQISQIANRSAINHNLDAEVWGAELEIDWRPLENLKIGFRGGYEKTRIGDGESMIDMIDRTAGDPDWAIIKPFPSYPSNCIGPRWYLENYAPQLGLDGFSQFCLDAYVLGLDPVTALTYVQDPTVTNAFDIPAGYPGFNPNASPNGGAGFSKDLSGNELPNAPDFTTTLTVDYTLLLPQDWLLTLHADLYRQSEAWTRVFNEDPYDKLKPFEQVNLAAIFTNEDAGWKVMAYIKNVFDKDNITGAFLNSDDSALTTNVFLNEPRLYGLRVTKEWTGGGMFDGFAARKGPFPLTVELGGGPLRVENEDEVFRPGWSDEFTSSDMPIPFSVQDEDLDWGDTREVKIAYKPVGSQWNVALGARFGRTNGTALLQNTEEVPGGYQTDPTPAIPQFASSVYYKGSQNYVNSEEKNRQEHTIIDFSVGRDLGLGLDSKLSAGLRYANFESSSALTMYGMPDLTIPRYYNIFSRVFSAKYQYFVTHHQHSAVMVAEREFKGAGPVLSWEASKALLGSQETGTLALDWGLSGGVLFGKQKASVTREEESEFFRFPIFNGIVGEHNPISVDAPPPESFVRSEDVEVPVAGVSLGLSYEIGRVKIGAGYSFERYFDAMDGGIEEAKQYDRDISGPYLKLRVGFGGG